MAQASATIIPGYTLQASTPAPGEAPVSYQVNGVTVGTDTTANINAGAGGLYFKTITNPDGTYSILAGQSNTKVFTGTSAQAASFTAGIDNATEKVLNSIHTSVVTLPPAPLAFENTPPLIPVTQPEVQTVTTIKTEDIVINTEPLVVPTIDINTGEVIGNTVVNFDPVIIPGETITADVTVAPSTGNTAPSATGPAIGLTTGITTAAAGATAQDQANFLAREDWRVRLSLAPGANYLYKVPGDKGILAPLAKTDGVIFPYTPGITVTYAANYDQTSITHTNYKINQYQNSSVESVNITCDFTAQDVFEANYLLAVIHFFRTMTKMFYGKDDSPIRGTPPPLCYIYGLGGFQFDALPLAITGFNYSLPQDVDYIKTTGPSAAGTPQPTTPNTATSTGVSAQRLGTGLTSGGKGAMPSYGSTPKQNSESTTWVPTKIQLAITCLPIMSRNAVSNRFSLKDYATGALLHGTRDGAKGGGFW